MIPDWNDKYRNVTEPGTAAAVLTENLHLLQSSGRALDLACGTGGNALTLASFGLQVDAWDTSSVAIEKLLRFADEAQLEIHARQKDAGDLACIKASYDVIVISSFLDRDLCPAIYNALSIQGLLFYQTFTQTRMAGSKGPSSPNYLLKDNELLQLFPGLLIRQYHEPGLAGDCTKGHRNVAWIVGQKVH